MSKRIYIITLILTGIIVFNVVFRSDKLFILIKVNKIIKKVKKM